MDLTPSGTTEFATNDDVRLAIEALSDIDKARLKKVASIHLAGSLYACPMDLLNETIFRTMNGAEGRGRHWPIHVPFMAYLIETMKGIAGDSRNSYESKHKRALETLATETLSADEVLSRDYLLHANSPEVELEEAQARQELEAQQDEDLRILNEAFKDDSEIQWILMGYKDGCSAAEIRELADMSQTTYESAQRRLRRKLEKLFGNRRVQ